MGLFDDYPSPPETCPRCGAVIHGAQSSPKAMIGIYSCGGEYLPGDPPGWIKACPARHRETFLIGPVEPAWSPAAAPITESAPDHRPE